MLGLVPTSIANIPIVVKVALPAGPMSELVRRDPLGVVWELPVGGRWRSMIGIRSTGLTNGDPRTRSLPLASPPQRLGWSCRLVACYERDSKWTRDLRL